MMHDIEVPAAAPARLIEENLQALSQLHDFVDGLTPAAYRRSFGNDGRHSLGRHVRHIIDHYDALLAGLEAGEIDYEHRRRDTRLELWPAEAASHLREIGAAMSRLGEASTRDELTLDYPLNGSSPLLLTTSLARELAFLTSHTIHHMALLGLLAESLDLGLPRTFGVHPSTLRHWEQETRRRESA